MPLFRSKPEKVKFGKFSEGYFKTEVQKILWQEEMVLAEGFFAHAKDPYGAQPLPVLLPGTSPYTYLAVTQWRFIEGFLANGEFASYEFQHSNPEIFKQRALYYFTYSNPNLHDDDYSRSTYLTSKEIAEAILRNLRGIKPSIPEKTKIFLEKEFFGEGPLADLARVKLQSEYMWIEVCDTCGGKMLVPDDSENSSQKSNNECRTCLRARI